MKSILALSAALLVSASGAFAGDAVAGEADFKKCKSCHTIESADEVIIKGGKTGPNLYGIVGSTVGAVEGFKYSKGLVEVGEAGLVWDEALLAEYLIDPSAFIETHGGSGRSKMTFKMKGGEDVAAYLASLTAE